MQDASPAGIVRDARARIAASSYQSESKIYEVNHTTGERTLYIHTEARIDRDDRQGTLLGRLRVVEENASDEWAEFPVYFDEGTIATNRSGADESHDDGSPSAFSLGGYRAGDWQVFASPGYREFSQGGMDHGALDDPDVGWRIVNRSGDRIVLGIDDPAKLQATDYFFESWGDRLVDEGSYVRLYVDRDTGRATRLVQRRVVTYPEDHEMPERTGTLEVTRFSGYDSTDIRRPDAIGSPGLRELVWDLAHY